MKPRRENGATFVSPMTSGVSMGSARMWGPPLGRFRAKGRPFASLLGRRIQQTIAAKGKSPACEVRPDRFCRWARGQGEGTKNKAVDVVYRQRPCQPRI